MFLKSTVSKILKFVSERPDVLVGAAFVALVPLSLQAKLISRIPGGRNTCLVIGSVSASYVASILAGKVMLSSKDDQQTKVLDQSNSKAADTKTENTPTGLGSGLPSKPAAKKKKNPIKTPQEPATEQKIEIAATVSEPPALTGSAAILARMKKDKQPPKESVSKTSIETVATDQEGTPVVPTTGNLTGSAALLAQMRQKRAEPPKKTEVTSDDSKALWVLYGGEAATQVAKDLATEMTGKGYCPKLLSLEQFKDANLESTGGVAVFVVETVENAQPAEAAGAAVRYFNRKRKAKEEKLLENKLRYCVMCLGDTNLLLDRQTTTAQDCNQAGQALDGALNFLGAQRLCKRCEANDAVGLEEAIEPWKEQHLWKALQACFKGGADDEPTSTETKKEGDKSVVNGGGDGQKEAEMKELLVLYGSQTGNSQEIAKQIAAECPEKGIQAKCFAMQEVKFETAMPDGTVVLFVVSSTGDGDPPDNCALFYSKVKKKSHPAGLLKGVEYTVLGLGDQNYTAFMEVPRILHKRMEALGASCFYPRGEADEVEGLDEYVEQWTMNLWEPLKAALMGGADKADKSAENGKSAGDKAGDKAAPVELEALKGVPALPACRLEVKWSPAGTEPAPLTFPPTDGGVDKMYSASSPFLAGVSESRLLTSSSSDRRVLHLDLDITASGVKYNPGDSLAVLPQNNPQEVQALLTRLGVEGDTVFELGAAEGSSGGVEVLTPHLASPGLTPRRCLTAHCDIQQPPRKTLLRTLAEFTVDPVEKHRLLQLCSRGGKDVYDRDIKGPQPSLLQLLNMVPSCRPPLASLLDALPPLQPRHYSLTCCQDECPDSAQVAFSVVSYTPEGGCEKKGVATNWLDMVAGPNTPKQNIPRIPIFFKKGGAFHPPQNLLDATMIMIGPGTGVAPFRGFLQARRAAMKTAPSGGAPAGQAWLFFGCRRKEEDFLYQHDFQEMLDDGTLTHLKTAFSRETDKKVYVQHRMMEHSAELCGLIMAGAYVYVCGDGGQMAKDVNTALVTILEKHSGMKDRDVSTFVRTMIQDHKYVRDIWS